MAFQTKFIVDMVVAIMAGVLLLLVTLRTKKLQRWGGAIMLAAYVAYFIYLIA